MMVNSNLLLLLSIPQINVINSLLSNKGELNKEVKVINHFSLRLSTSNMHFRNTYLHVYGDIENQFIIEDNLIQSNNNTNELSSEKNEKCILSVKNISTKSLELILLL